MSLLRRQFLSLLATTSTLAMNPSRAADTAPPEMAHLPWSRHAAIHEINVRQYSADGTLAAVTADLPRLKALGVDIVWLMPLQPIGRVEREGTLGSDDSIHSRWWTWATSTCSTIRRTLGTDSVTVVVNVTKAVQSFDLGAAGRSLPDAGGLIETA